MIDNNIEVYNILYHKQRCQTSKEKAQANPENYSNITSIETLNWMQQRTWDCIEQTVGDLIHIIKIDVNNDYILVWKWIKPRNPILFGIGVAVCYDYLFHFYDPVPQGH